MRFQIRSTLTIIALLLLTASSASSQGAPREFRIAGNLVEVVNLSGRVAIRATPDSDGSSLGLLTVQAPGVVSESDVKINTNGGKTSIEVSSSARQKRIDLILSVPEGTRIKIETSAGAIEAVGRFLTFEAKTDTGTIVADVPEDLINYSLSWTESRPRFLADFELSKVKEMSAGRFEIKGSHRGNGSEDDVKAVTLRLTTARGIILINVPPNEVMSDLRERPLTNAAKAIIRSGDSLLMEAVRRASPRYFSDYSRTLPPLKLEPRFAERRAGLVVPDARVKTATVRITDLKNRAIPGLTASDFEVIEDGREREVVSVERSEAPFNLVLLLDVSGSVENYVNFIRKAARNFIDTVGVQDRVAIVIFNEDVKMLSTFTTDKGILSESLDTFDAGGGTAYYDALAYAISDTLRPLKGDRTAIVVLTDGDDNRSFLAFDSLAGSIQESGALIYPLYVPSALIALAAQNPNADIDPLRKKYMSLTAKSEGEGERLAKLSGGVYYPISEVGQIQEAYEDIVIQMRMAYRVTYRSEASGQNGNGASPKLKIRAKRENTFATITEVTAAK